MHEEDKLKLIQIVERLDVDIQRLAVQMFGSDAVADSPAYNLSLLLPDLLGNALAGDLLPEGEEAGTPVLEYGPGEDGDDPDIRSAVQAAEEYMRDPGAALPALEVSEQVTPTPTPTSTLSFSEIVKDKRVHPDAVEWARGVPAKEAALIETLLGLHEGLWGISQVPKLAERTYETRTSRSDLP